MIKKIFSVLLLLFLLTEAAASQTTVQAGLAFNGTSLLVCAKPNGILDGYFSGGKVTITWPVTYGITLGTVSNTTGNWAVSGSGTSGGYNYVNYSSTTTSAFSWTAESVNKLFSIPVTVNSGTGSFSLVNGVPDSRGNWYFEVGGYEKSNTANSFYCPSVTLGSPKVQAGLDVYDTKLIIKALPDANLNGNFSGGIVTVSWPSSYGVTLGTITNTAGVWQVTGTGTTGANTYVNFANVNLYSPVNWTGGSLNVLFTVEVNQTGSGKGTFTLINGVPDINSGSWYFEYGGSDLTNNTNPFYNQIINNVPLPVELTSFTAEIVNEDVELQWTTAMEVNNYGFEIERKSASWEKIGFIPGSGNSSTPRKYTFTDKHPASGTEFAYRLKQVDNDGGFKYYEAVKVVLAAPNEFKLLQNSPNPFNPTTSIKFLLPSAARVNIVVYNILGKEVATLINEEKPAGSHIVFWNGRDNNGNMSASGIYLYRIQAGTYVETRKMNLMK